MEWVALIPALLSLRSWRRVQDLGKGVGVDKLGVFQAALGITEPWRVTEAIFDPERGRLDLQIDFARGARFGCPECDEDACPVHDTEQKTWRHLDFFQHQAYLHARVPRVRCPGHGGVQIGLVLEEVQMPPRLLLGVMHRAGILVALRTAEPRAAP